MISSTLAPSFGVEPTNARIRVFELANGGANPQIYFEKTVRGTSTSTP